MKAAIWTLYGVFWTAVMTIAVTAVWTSTNDDLSSRLGNTAGVLAGGGGVGKTQLAAWFAHHAVSEQSTDLVVWVPAGTEEQIITALKQYESGDKTTDICRKLGISQATFYLWKKQYAGLGVQELRELRQLRDENGRLKRLVADLSLDRQILQEIVSKKL